MKRASPVTQPHRVEILRRWAEDRPKAGNELEAWYESVAQDIGISEERVRNVLAIETDGAYARYHDELRTNAQNIADALGATVTEALTVLRDSLHAEEILYLRDGHGNPIYDKGEPVVLHRPLHTVRLKSCELLLNVHDAFAPAKIEMKVEETIQLNVSALDTAAARERLAVITREIGELLDGAERFPGLPQRIAPAAPGGSRSDPDGTDGPAWADRPVVLGHTVDEDKG